MIRYARKKTKLQERLDVFEALYRDKEPRIHSFIPEDGRFKRLRQQAAAVERRVPKPRRLPFGRSKLKSAPPLPALHAMLLGVKDIFHVDGFPTHAGSRLPARDLRGAEAASVSALRKAGMLVAGKTVTTEFAYFSPGPTRNPHNTEHTPGGSSSGSAAAVAAGLVDLALGTQTIGSIIRPASYCGVVGFKPSYGRISTEGVIPLARSLDHVGLFAPDVGTIARAAQVLCVDWSPSTGSPRKPYLAAPIGPYLGRANEEMRTHFENLVNGLESAGYQVKRLDPFADFDQAVERHNLILAAEAAQAHARWYEDYRSLYHQKTAALVEKGFTISAQDLKTALNQAEYFGSNLSTLMQINGIDLWISPSATGPAPKGIASTGDPIMNLPWTQAGFPTLSLPAGFSQDGLPLGLQVSADLNGDEDLLAWSATIEQDLLELV
ncbi:MAG: amidase [Anaerolineales bacterium]